MNDFSLDGARAKPKPIVSAALAIVGLVHVSIVGMLFPEAVRSVITGGVVASIEADPGATTLRSMVFWYETTGVALIFLAGLVFWIERTYGSVPAFLGWALLGLAVWGLIFLPVSPFWIFIPIAGLAFWSARRGRRSRRAAPSEAVNAPR